MVLIIEHVEGEGPGLLAGALDLRQVELCQVWRGDALPDRPRHQALIVLGGPQAAWDPLLQAEAQWIGDYARAGLPVLGVCLGAQLLARGLGARNFRGPQLEKGVFPLQLSDEGRRDPLVGHLEEAVQWHEDTFELPEGAVRLASSAMYLEQAFRWGPRAYGVQFHIECDAGLRRSWELPPGDDAPGVRFAQAFSELVFSSPRR